MCKKAYRRDVLAPLAAGAYEGRTMRMDDLPEVRAERRRACGGGGFPWWLLWLIWPAAGLIKWAAPIWIASLAALHSTIGADGQPFALAIAILLIAAGIALIRRG